MRDTGYVAVAVRRPGGAAVYGPCPSPQEMHQAISLLGLADQTIWATRTMALTSPHTWPDTLLACSATATTLMEVPPGVVHVINAYPPAPTTGQDPAVVLAITRPPHHAATIGPFATGEEATRWAAQHGGLAETGPLARCLVLPLQPLTPHAIQASATSLPAVVGVTTSTGSVIVGPFPNSVHATRWFHDAAFARFTNMERAVVFTATPPFDATEEASPPPAAPYVEGRDTRLFVAVIHDRTQMMAGAVGFFDSHHAAQAWWDTQEHHFPGVTAEVFSVTEPDHIDNPSHMLRFFS